MRTIEKEDLESLFTKFRNGARNHIITTCPYCGKADHFYLNRSSQQWDCKKCGEDGNIFKLLNFLGKLYLIGDFKSIERSRIKLLGEFEEDEDEKIELITPIRKLPIGFKRIYENEYLKTRKFVKRNFEDNIIGTTRLKPSLKDYIIFSVNEIDGCKGFLSRYSKPIPEEQKKLILRYRNDRGANFSKLLYGFEKVTKQTKTLILVEGLIDKITLDNFLRLDLQPDIKSLATFGKKISQSQVLKMLEAGVEDVILIFDYDAIKEMKKFSLELAKYFNVLIGFTFSKDINDSNDLEIGKIFENLKGVRDFNKKTVKML
jgi:DNA primase